MYDWMKSMRHQHSEPVQHFPVVPVAIPRGEIENRGARRKFWVSIVDDGVDWLLKFPRPNTGEHWAEKVAAEIGRLYSINTARVELARAGGELATVCQSFLTGTEALDYEADSFARRLHGSEFLDLTVLDYDPDLVRSNRAHNVKTIVNAFENLGSTSEVHNWKEILNDLASFVLLDALVGNTDRHHDNWMLLYSVDAGNIRMRAAPSYDHASSLGRELTDERREQIISANRMLNYVKRGRGGVFIDAAGIRAPSPLRLAQLLGRWRSEIAADWMERLGPVHTKGSGHVIIHVWNLHKLIINSSNRTYPCSVAM